MNSEERITRITSGTSEVVTQDELVAMVQSKKPLKAYVGLEPSGRAHLGLAILARKVRDLTDSDVETIIFLADWHAFINDKLGGNMDSIRTCGEYFKDCFLALGVDPERTSFVYASELIGREGYWEKVLRVAKASSLNRIRRCLTIMGRQEDEADTDSSKFIYPAMQVADIFELDVDIAYGGMDQRKAHMLMRDVREKMGSKPVAAIHTPLLAGLDQDGRMDSAEAKMSKSNPDSCIFLHDREEDVRRKIKKAYCPEGVVEGNPILDMVNHLLFPRSEPLVISRPEKWGGNLEYSDAASLVRDFEDKQLHPADLKKAVATALVEHLDPVREYFESNPKNMKAVQKLTVTR